MGNRRSHHGVPSVRHDPADANAIPIGVAIAGANRNDIKLLEPTLDSIITNDLLDDIELLALDRGDDFPVICERLAGYDLTKLEIQKRGTKPPPETPLRRNQPRQHRALGRTTHRRPRPLEPNFDTSAPSP
jgi:hypothetical protein